MQRTNKISRFNKCLILQHDRSDCGIACLLSIIKYYSGINTLENLRRLSGTTTSGTTLLGLHEAARQTGFDAEGCEANIEILMDYREPIILHAILENDLHHYVVYFATVQKNGEVKFIIGDPAKGIIYLNQQQLNKIWKTKTCLTLKPNEHFSKATEIRKAKSQWIKELIRQDIAVLGIAVVIGIAMSTLGLAMALFSQRLIDDILPKKDFTKLNLGIALVFTLLLIKEGLSVFRQYLLLHQSKDFNIRIIDFFYTHLLQLPKPFFDSRKIGELVSRLNDTNRIQRVISKLAGNVAIDLLIALVSTIFVFTYSSSIGLLCLVGVPVFYLIIYRYNKKITEGPRSIMSQSALVQANYISTLQGIEPIKNYNKQSSFSTRNNRVYGTFQDKIISLGKVQIKLSFLANSFSILFLISIVLFASYQVLNNNLKTGELMAILTMSSSLLQA